MRKFLLKINYESSRSAPYTRTVTNEAVFLKQLRKMFRQSLICGASIITIHMILQNLLQYPMKLMLYQEEIMKIRR